MSRVFEALTKAGHEKEYRAENTPKESEENVQQVLSADDKTFPIPDWASDSNGVDRDTSATVPKFTAELTSSWRERIQELFFGWD
jgi:hypothetical protein